MTDEEAKRAILLNYGMMMSDLGLDLKEKTDFMSHFFHHNPNMNTDGDLMDIAMQFEKFLTEFKRLDKIIEAKSQGVL